MSILASHGLVALVVLALTGAAYLTKLLNQLDREELARRTVLRDRLGSELRALRRKPAA